jgi:hypothetical protein
MTDSPHTRTARCGCGSLTVTTVGEPAAVYACACLRCQQKSGGAFTYSAVFDDHAITTAGERRTWRHHGNSGRWIESCFCPGCGITVFSRSEIFPGATSVSVGCFSDPHFAPPQRVYWTSRQHRWLAFPDDIEHQDTQPH